VHHGCARHRGRINCLAETLSGHRALRRLSDIPRIFNTRYAENHILKNPHPACENPEQIQEKLTSLGPLPSRSFDFTGLFSGWERGGGSGLSPSSSDCSSGITVCRGKSFDAAPCSLEGKNDVNEDNIVV